MQLMIKNWLIMIMIIAYMIIKYVLWRLVIIWCLFWDYPNEYVIVSYTYVLCWLTNLIWSYDVVLVLCLVNFVLMHMVNILVKCRVSKIKFLWRLRFQGARRVEELVSPHICEDNPYYPYIFYFMFWIIVWVVSQEFNSNYCSWCLETKYRMTSACNLRIWLWL